MGHSSVIDDLLTELAQVKAPDAQRIELCRDHIRIDFPAGELAVSVVDGADDGRCRLSLALTVRSTGPDLNTWWREWSVTTERASAVTAMQHEVDQCCARFHRLLLGIAAPTEEFVW